MLVHEDLAARTCLDAGRRHIQRLRVRCATGGDQQGITFDGPLTALDTDNDASVISALFGTKIGDTEEHVDALVGEDWCITSPSGPTRGPKREAPARQFPTALFDGYDDAQPFVVER